LKNKISYLADVAATYMSQLRAEGEEGNSEDKDRSVPCPFMCSDADADRRNIFEVLTQLRN
jgi:hypothetical protein